MLFVFLSSIEHPVPRIALIATPHLMTIVSFSKKEIPKAFPYNEAHFQS